MPSQEEHPFIAATRLAATSWNATPDGRLQPLPEPGLLEVRVSRAQLDRALNLVATVITASVRQGLEVSPIARSRFHRAGVSIGDAGRLTAIWLEERRDLERFTEEALELWRPEAEMWIRSREWLMRDRGWCPRANGRLRLRLPRRYDPSPEDGWRHSFSDQDGRPLEEKVGEVVAALKARAMSTKAQEAIPSRFAATGSSET